MVRARSVLLHLEAGHRVPVAPEEVFFLEAVGDETEVRTRGRRRLRDVRSLSEVLVHFPTRLFVQIHRSYAINADRVAEVRRRHARSRGWEVKLEPPVNRVLPVGRTHLQALWTAYAGQGIVSG